MTLGMENDFTSEDWSSIRRSENIVASYFIYKELKYDADKDRNYYRLSADIPQGSVLDPVLKNIKEDGVLRLPYRREQKWLVSPILLLWLWRSWWTGQNENRSKNKPIKTEI